MYHSHFGLNQAPFNITPNPAFFYSGSKRGDILEALIYAVSHGEGIIKVTGEVGSGKTMLCRMLESMMPEHVEVIYLVNPTLSREEVMFTIAGELEIPTEGKRPDEVIRLLHQDLISKHIRGKQVVLLVEEAQAMPLETLEEIRLFSNLETAHHKLLQIVLFGQPELNQNLNLPRMRQLKERITHSFNVPPMTAAIIPDFLMFRLRTAGYHGPDIFNRGAIRLLASVSEGIVRRINILADKSLLAAFADNSHAVQAKHVKEAILDSEFVADNKLTHTRRKLVICVVAIIVLLLAVDFVWRSYPTKASGVPAPKIRAEAPISLKHELPLSEMKASDAPNIAIETNELKRKIELEIGHEPHNKTVDAQRNSLVASSAASHPMDTNSKEIDTPHSPLIGFARQRTLASKMWLREQPAANFTIQLAMIDANKSEELETFLKKAANRIDGAELFIYPSRVNGNNRFGIVVESYGTREEASKKRVELEQKWAYRGQIRTIGGLRNEIWRSQSEDLW